MGVLNLEDFREELSTATGNRGFTNPQLDRWINFAYLDVAGALDLDELEDDSDVATVGGQAYIAKPTDSTRVLAVIDDTNGTYLQHIDKTEYFRLNRTTTGAPVKWAELKERIYLHPTPSAIITMKVLHKIEPAPLTATTDVTVLDATWDAGIWMLAAHYAFMAVGDDQKAVLWMNRAISYMQSRVTAEEIFVREPGLGLSMSVPKERLLAAMEGMIGGNVGAQ